MGGVDGHTTVNHQYRNNGDLERFVDELVTIARKNYRGIITYADWWSQGKSEINWKPMDMVSQNIYYHRAYDQYFSAYVIYMKNKSKPLIISETGSLTIAEADDIGAGGDFTYLETHKVNWDMNKQSQIINKELSIFYHAGVYGIFVHVWDEPISHRAGDMNQLGYGVWDYINKVPKPSFWIIYKYYKD